MEHIIEIQGLSKSYRDINAIKGIDFYVEKGKLFAFLGPNGAGKSTTVEILATLLGPDSGNVRIKGFELGKNDENIRKCIGVVFQDSLLDNLLTVRENLILRGSFYKLGKKELNDAVENAAHICGVSEFLDRPYGKLSGGQRRRSDIARALINAPEILFLDEPTTGLDPQTRKNIWNTIRLLQEEKGMTVFLTTHYMEEAAEADYVIVIDHGSIAAKGTPSQLKDQYTTDRLILTVNNDKKLMELLNLKGLSYSSNADNIYIRVDSTFEALPLIDLCREYIDSFEVLKGTMDDVFIAITGREMRE